MLDRAAANAPTSRDAFNARAAYHRGQVYSPHHRAQVERAERAARAYDGLDKLRATFDLYTAPPIPKAPEVAEAAAVASANDAARDYWQAERDQARGRPGRFGFTVKASQIRARDSIRARDHLADGEPPA